MRRLARREKNRPRGGRARRQQDSGESRGVLKTALLVDRLGQERGDRGPHSFLSHPLERLVAPEELSLCSFLVAGEALDDDDPTAKAFALADNRSADLGVYDDDALLSMLQEVALDADLLAAASYGLADLEKMMRPLPQGDAAIASYLLHLKTQATDKKTTDEVYQETDVWFKAGGGWKITHVHYSPATPATHQ